MSANVKVNYPFSALSRIDWVDIDREMIVCFVRIGSRRQPGFGLMVDIDTVGAH